MNKKLAVTLAASAVAALALSGCGDDGNKERDAWAKKVCDQVRPEVNKIQQANAAMAGVAQEKPSSEEVKKTDSEAFQQLSEAYAELAHAVSSAGVPPVDNGAQLQKDATEELKAISTSYGQLRQKVDKLETDNQKKFAQGLTKVAGQLDELGRSGDQALSKLWSGDLGKAMAKQEGCKNPSETEDS